MGALIVGTMLFALMAVLAYFCVSVVWRNDKDSQAYVVALYLEHFVAVALWPAPLHFPLEVAWATAVLALLSSARFGI